MILDAGRMPMNETPLLSVRKLSQSFKVGKKRLKALNEISFDLKPGTTFGLVGESGCGKSTLAKTITRLHEPTSGEIVFDGQDISKLKGSDLFEVRRDMQMIFQDPLASLNPRMTAEELIAEPLIIYGMHDREARLKRVHELLFLVGLHRHHGSYFPHEFSGGQRQRICIARALALHPKLLICDEPLASLDVSIQAQIVNLLKDLQRKMGLSYLFISHDLGLVRYLCDNVAVMYLGHIVELGTSEQIFAHPRHPYTQGLLAAIPKVGFLAENHNPLILGELPSPLSPPSGCPFSSRCPYVKPFCKEKSPSLCEKQKGHFSSCHL